MANYIVSYDLNGPNPTHHAMDKHMEKAGWARGRILETVWYVGTTHTLQQVAEYVNDILSQNDRLMVVPASDIRYRNLLIKGESVVQAFASNA